MSTVQLDATSLRRWRADPALFVEQVLVNPETGKPFELLPAEQAFLDHAFKTGESGRLLYGEQIFAAPKKSGKTGFAALYVLIMTWLYGGRFPEIVLAANDLDQSVGRVFEAVKRIIEHSPRLAKEASITANKITFPAIGGTITANPSDHAGAAGANPVLSVFDELWGYVSERSRRLWDEMVPPPTRMIAARLVVTYAGYEGESELLWELYRRGSKQPEVAPSLRAGDGMLMAWHHEPIAPWRTAEWLEDMRRSLRPGQYLRMICNEFVSSESSFCDMDDWDACVSPDIRPVASDKSLPVWVGVDASVKHDSTAIAVVAWNAATKRVVLVSHRIFQPTPDRPLDFEQCVENTVKDYARQFIVRGVFFDPYQMVATAQRLQAAGIPMREFNQSGANLTVMGNNLYGLIKARQLVVYPDKAIRLAVSRTVAKETPRGLQITKEKASHKIDVVVALAMAALHAVERGQRDGPPLIYDPVGLIPRVDVGDSVGDLSHLHVGAEPGSHLSAGRIAGAGPSYNPGCYSPWDVDPLYREIGGGGAGISLAHLGVK
jgi:hypothetical protein